MKSIFDPRYRGAIMRLREARKALGLRQADLAKAVGVGRTTISGIETFERRADILETYLIARALDLHLSDLELLLEEGGEDETAASWL